MDRNDIIKLVIANQGKHRLLKGGKPNDKQFYKASKSTYEKKAYNAIDGYQQVHDGPSIDAFLNPNSREILIGIRGTGLSVDDVTADVNIVGNNLKNTTRYKKDVIQMEEIFAKYPPDEGYTYYLGAHSLGSAIIAELKRQFPFLKDAVVFNGALQPIDIANQPTDMKFKYIDKDPLYNIIGKSVKNKEVFPFEELKKGSFFGRLGAKLQPTALKAHKLEQFENRYGGSKKSGFVAAIIAKKPNYPKLDIRNVKHPSKNLRDKAEIENPQQKQVQSVIFPKKEGWNIQKARKWMLSKGIVEKDKSIRVSLNKDTGNYQFIKHPASDFSHLTDEVIDGVKIVYGI
jgi:hypothetical protein